jgi:hypothetical protein
LRRCRAMLRQARLAQLLLPHFMVLYQRLLQDRQYIYILVFITQVL